LFRTTALVATIGVVVALIGIAVMARPVSTPVQDCGSALVFLLDGGVNEFADPTDPPAGLTSAEVTDNNTRPCRERVADTARPGLVAFLAGTLIATAAAITEVSARGWRWHRRRTMSLD
jgi:hypothetical protein